MERDIGRRWFFYFFFVCGSFDSFGNCCIYGNQMFAWVIISSKQRTFWKLNIFQSRKLKQNPLAINSAEFLHQHCHFRWLFHSFSANKHIQKNHSFCHGTNCDNTKQTLKLRKVISYGLRWCPQMMIAAYQTNKIFLPISHHTDRFQESFNCNGDMHDLFLLSNNQC